MMSFLLFFACSVYLAVLLSKAQDEVDELQSEIGGYKKDIEFLKNEIRIYRGFDCDEEI